MRRRKAYGIIAPEILDKLLDVAQLAAKIHLAQQRPAKFNRDIVRPIVPQLSAVFLAQVGEGHDDVEIRGDLVFDVVMQHLDYDAPAVAQTSAMELAD